MTYKKELDIALKAVRSASVVCRSVASQLHTRSLEKEDRSPVTVADFGSQAVICRTLQAAFPEDPVIAEEDSAKLRLEENRNALERVVEEVHRIEASATADAVCSWIDRGNATEYSDRFWTLDPIDGTKGFLRGDQYAIALALVVKGEIVAAALGCPKLPSHGGTGCIFAATKGDGALVFDLEGEADGEPIRVSEIDDPSEARFCESYESEHSSHSDAAAVAELLDIDQEPLRLDSQAKYAVVARGDADIYLRLTKHTGYVENIWDHAAGALVIEEAGGQVTDVNGRPLDFRRGTRLERNVGIVATNGRVHQQVISALDKILVSN